MIVWLVRHTKTTVPDGICYGCTDVDLPAEFADEAAPLLQQIKATAPAEVHSSPLKRCQALAGLIGSVRADARLAELNFGRWEMQPWESINASELDQWRNGLVDWVVPEGESVGQLAGRVESFLGELRGSDAASACVVTHAGVIRVSICILWKQDLASALDVRIPLGGALKIELNKTEARLLEVHGFAKSGLPEWVR